MVDLRWRVVVAQETARADGAREDHGPAKLAIPFVGEWRESTAAASEAFAAIRGAGCVLAGVCAGCRVDRVRRVVSNDGAALHGFDAAAERERRGLFAVHSRKGARFGDAWISCRLYD